MNEIDGISIVVATKGRVNLLKELLVGIQEARKLYDKPCETILVDDSSEKEQAEIQALCEEYDAHLEKFTASVAMKRNHGVQIAQYELILFLDSDCNPVPEILQLHESYYTEDAVGAVAGPLEFVGEENRFWKCVRLTPYLICFKMPYWGETVPWGATANFSVRRSVYLEVGGFSPVFPNKPGGEDVDLGLLITEAGYKIMSAPKAVVYHAKETWSQKKQMYRRAWYYGAADYYLVDRHKSMTCSAVPKRSVIAFWACLAMILLAVIKSPLLLLGIPLWILADIGSMSAIMSRVGYEKSTFFQQWTVQKMIIVNELGYVLTCLKKGKPSYINDQIIYFDNQLKGSMTNSHITFWRTLLCTFTFFVLVCVLRLCGIL